MLGDHEEARGAPVEPVDDPRPAHAPDPGELGPAVGQERVNQSPRPVARARMHDESDGLVHHEEVGVTPVLYYDAPGRLVRTDMPDGTYSRVEQSPWQVTSYDASDTAYDPDPAARSDWYNRRTDPAHPRYAEFNDPGRSALLTRLTAAFNEQLGVNILLDGRYIGLVQADLRIQAMVQSPGGFGLANVTDGACSSSVPPPVCTIHTLVDGATAGTWNGRVPPRGKSSGSHSPPGGSSSPRG